MHNIIISSKHIETTESMKQSVENQLAVDLEHFENFIVEQVRVTIEANLAQSTDNFNVSVRVPVKGNDLFSSGKGSTLKDAISDATVSLSRQFRKLKTKKLSNKRVDLKEEIGIDDID